MIRVLKSVDGSLQEDPELTIHAPATAKPSARAIAANTARNAYVTALTTRNREAVESITDPALQRSLQRGLRGR